MVKTNSLSKKIKKCDIMDNKLRREFITFLSQRESDKKINSLIDEAISRQIPMNELKDMVQEQALYMEYLGELQQKTGHVFEGRKKNSLSNNTSGKYRTLDRGTSLNRSLKSISDNTSGRYRTMDRGTIENKYKIKDVKNNSVGKKFISKDRKDLDESNNDKLEDIKPKNNNKKNIADKKNMVDKKENGSKDLLSFEEIKNVGEEKNELNKNDELNQDTEKNQSKIKKTSTENLGIEENETILNNMIISSPKG